MKRIAIEDIPVSAQPYNAEVEATEFMVHKLTSIKQQNIAALNGIQHFDKATYRLEVDGQVNHPLKLSYADLLAYQQKSQLVELNCVEGWNYVAKWTGPTLKAIFADAGVKTEAKLAIFHTADVPEGFSSLELNYVFKNNIIIALKNNDVTLTAEKGFPFQVVAMNDFKWAKWVTRIELTSDTSFRGYSESNAYNSVFCNCNIEHPWWRPWWWPW